MTKLAIKTEWDLSAIINSSGTNDLLQYRHNAEKIVQDFVVKRSQRDDFCTDPLMLLEALKEYESLKLFYPGGGVDLYYFEMQKALNSQDTDVTSHINKISLHSRELSNMLEFFTNRIGKISSRDQQRMLEFQDLAPYKHFLELQFDFGNYTLTEKEENIINSFSKIGLDNRVDMVEQFLSQESVMVSDGHGQEKSIPFSGISEMLSHSDKMIRDSAGLATHNLYRKHLPVAEKELNTVLEFKQISDKIRGFVRPDQEKHMMDDISSDVVDALIEAVVGRYDISRDFYAFKATFFGREKIGYHERNIALTSEEYKISYEEAVNIVYDSFSRVDQDFGDIFKQFVEGGFIDVYPRIGKRGGAFCAYGGLNSPVYVFLNYNNSVNDVNVLAHEMGHAINDIYIQRVQSSLTYSTPLSTAEVASTFFENIVFDELVSRSTPEQQFSLLAGRMNDSVSTIFRQIACYQFEQSLHRDFREKGYLSKEHIGENFLLAMQGYMGSHVDYSPGSENRWIGRSHIRSFFYVYSYASGELISSAMYQKYKKNPAFLENIKKFLSAGRSATPKQIFADLGIDISDKKFWEEGLELIDNQLQTLKKLASDLGKI